MPKLILIDGSSYLYRAFHALPPLSNARGEPTGALFGVVNMLRATLKAKPDYLAFVGDAPGPTFRDTLYAQYKANRPPMPDDLRSQVEPMLAIVGALGFPILCVPGVEADDVIGTLAVQAQALGIDVLVSTGDKDMAQLVSPHVTLVNTMSNTVMDRDGVMEKFGVWPEQIIDFLSLTGDAIDNIPGVPKCGPKTAAKWLAEYATLDGVIANADKVGGKIGESLRAALPQLPLSRQLATIKTDVPLEFGPTDLAQRVADTAQLRELYTRYEFKAALKDLDAAEQATGIVEPQPGETLPAEPAVPAGPVAVIDAALSAAGEYELVTTQAQLDAWLGKLRRAELIAFDTETTSIDAMRADIVGISFAVEPDKACYIPLGHDYPGAPKQLDRDAVLAALKPVFEDPSRPKLGQHAKYDINILSNYGIVVQGLKHDSMLESYVWNATATRHDMDSLAKKYLGYDTVKYEQVAGKGAKQISFSQVDLDTACRYAAEDSDITLRLHLALWPKLESVPALRRVYEDIEIPLMPVLAAMEQRGVLIDGDELRRQSQQLGKRMLELQQQSYALAGREFNLDSPKQLQAVLFDELGLQAKLKTPTGQPSTNEEALEAIADSHELPRLILDYRGLAKLRSTYTDKLSGIVNPRTGRVHTSYHQGSVATGRISSSDPNLQNIPVRTEEGRRIRQAFIAPPGWQVLAADYSQIELRIMAHLSGDEGLLRAFHEGGDIHRATAAEVFGLKPEEVSANQRRAAKAINFGLMYGMSAFGLARQLGVDRGEAGDYMARYFARYPGVHAFMEATREQAHRDGYVETIFGRRLYLENLTSRNQGLRQGAERAAVNAPMQGSAADIIKRAMIAVAAWLKDRDDAHMLMQVHDELVFEVRADAVDVVRAAVVERMSGAAELAVPLLVDVGVGANWDEAH
ncbi:MULTISPECIES: DNA polymerase I [unclassified Rhodanobacter]|uniref:DNA polymerase I n=1 Tax=unclassified Rhodanobacter TaxID=2621553 RepID=UPI001BDF541E|nr:MULTISPECIES: DNA polymerase I [unclassified Rhodanobacter]MBT2144419.1 DNA polymerase I [Rhodanobacter sp. LX-99]MBT2149914.1 DNA polymerase I [Rhodanobacter sp. LX-100]